MNVVCCQVQVSATSWSLVQRSPTDCGVSLCDLEKITLVNEDEGQDPLRGYRAKRKKNVYIREECPWKHASLDQNRWWLAVLPNNTETLKQGDGRWHDVTNHTYYSDLKTERQMPEVFQLFDSNIYSSLGGEFVWADSDSKTQTRIP